MATLQKIRDKGVLLVIVVGVALVAFVLGDLLTSGTTLMERGHDRAFVVDGETITTQEYADRVAAMEEFHRILGGQMLDENASIQIREQVYQQMVRERLIRNQATRLGLTVTRAELNDLVHGEVLSPILYQLPFFIDHQTGMLDRTNLMTFLSMLNTPNISPEEQAMWLVIENMILTHRLEEKYFTLLSNAVMINNVEVYQHFNHSQQNTDIAFALQPFFAFSDAGAQVTDREVRDFYNRHRSNFILEAPLVRLSYFVQDIRPSDDDFAAVQAEAVRAAEELAIADNVTVVVSDFSETPFHDVFVNENLLSPAQIMFVREASIGDIEGPVREGDLFQVFKLVDQIVAPDSVRLRMMGIPMMGFGQDSIVMNFVDSIYAEIRGGVAFADVANSINPHANGGEVGWAREVELFGAGFGADAVQTIFNTPVGQPVRISVPGQELVIQVEERTQPITKHKLAIINMPVIPSERTTNNIDNELNQFISHPEAETRFTELAAERGFMIIPNATFSANDFGLSAGMMRIPGSRQVITWAVNERRMGSIRRFDLPNMRIVARVDEIIPAGIAPLSEVQSGIRMRLTEERLAEQLISQLEAQQLTSLQSFADAMGSTIDTVRFVNFTTRTISGVGHEPVLNAVAGYAPLHTVQGPMAGNMGIFVAQPIERTQGVAEFDLELHRNTMLQENMQRLHGQTVETLRETLGVEDFRFRFW